MSDDISGAYIIPTTMPYDSKSHRALEHDPKFADDNHNRGPLGMKRRDDIDSDWGPLGVRQGGLGYSAGRR